MFFVLMVLAAQIGCEKDIREPGEPRIVANPALANSH
jgi:hypothetical protein